MVYEDTWEFGIILRINLYKSRMKLSHKNLPTILVTVLALGAVFFAGIKLGESKIPQVERVATLDNKELNKPENVDFSAFWKAWNVVNEKFVPVATSSNNISDQDKVWGAIAGLADSLNDPHTVFFRPIQNQIFEADVRGNFEGVGMEIGIRDGVLTVIAPLKGTPAERAGIKSGDKILKIDNQSTQNLTTEEAVTRIRGKQGTEVIFSILHDGEKEPLDIKVNRGVIDIPTLESRLLPNGVYEINLFSFSSVSPDLFRQALREFVEARTDKLIIDLRGNPGGFLEAALDMASWFLPPGKVIVTEDFGGKRGDLVHRSRGYDIFTDELKLVILVDGGSASASEILAGALQDYGKAKLVGEKTFGKGSVQELVEITPDTSLKITIARWLTPNKISISESGIVPDFVVSPTEDDIEKGVDTARNKAIDILLSWPGGN